MPADAANGDFEVVTNKAIYTFARKGGYLKRIEMKEAYKFAPKDSAKPRVVLFDGDANSINIDLMLKNQAIVHSKDLTFSSDITDSLVVSEGSGATFEDETGTPDAKYDDRKMIQQALSQLPPKERQLAVLYSEGFSYKEMSEIVDIRFSSVGKTLSRVINKLYDILKSNGYETFER